VCASPRGRRYAASAQGIAARLAARYVCEAEGHADAEGCGG